MYFEGNNEVLVNLFRKKKLLEEGNLEHQEIRPALLILSGVMCGVYAGGQTIALDKFGLRDVFDVGVGVSTGAPVAAYFLGGHIESGLTIYWKECTTSEFISMRRCLTGGHVVDVDYLANTFRGETSRGVKLNQEAIHKSRASFYTAATCAETGEGFFLDAKKVEPDIVEALKATIAIPGLSHGNVNIGGRRFLDGAGSLPFPALKIINEFNPTDLLVLTNCTPPPWGGNELLEKILAPIFWKGISDKTKEVFSTRRDRFVEGLKSLRQQKRCRFAILWSDDQIGAFERNSTKLESAAVRAEIHFSEILRDVQNNLRPPL